MGDDSNLSQAALGRNRPHVVEKQAAKTATLRLVGDEHQVEIGFGNVQVIEADSLAAAIGDPELPIFDHVSGDRIAGNHRAVASAIGARSKHQPRERAAIVQGGWAHHERVGWYANLGHWTAAS